MSREHVNGTTEPQDPMQLSIAASTRLGIDCNGEPFLFDMVGFRSGFFSAKFYPAKPTCLTPAALRMGAPPPLLLLH